MSGVYKRINTLLGFLKENRFDSSHDIWSALAHPQNKVLPIEHLYDLTCCVDEKEKLFLYSGCKSSFEDGAKVRSTYMLPLSEDDAEKVYEALQGIALKRIEGEYCEEENRLRELKKKNYLNNKIFGQSVSFIMEELWEQNGITK